MTGPSAHHGRYVVVDNILRGKNNPIGRG